MTPKSEESGYVECEKEEEQVKEQLKVAYAYSSPLIDKAGEHAATGFDWLKKALGTVTGTEKVGFDSTPLSLSLGVSLLSLTPAPPPFPPSQVYQWLQVRVEDEAFLRCLEDSREAKVSGHVSNSPALKQVESEVLSKREGAFDEERANGEEAEGLSEGWELVEKEEVLDAMASFIAAYIQVSPLSPSPSSSPTRSPSDPLSLSLCPLTSSSLQAHPEASKMRPEQLQQALSVAFKELRKSKIVVLWNWGSAIWRLGAMSYGAFTVYTNPWLVRTVLQAVWCCSRLALGTTAAAVGLL